MTFSAWLRSHSDEKVAAMTADYFSVKQAEAAWLATQPVAPKDGEAVAKARRIASRVAEKIAAGAAYLVWRRGAGAGAKAPLQDVVLNVSAYSACHFRGRPSGRGNPAGR